MADVPPPDSPHAGGPRTGPASPGVSDAPAGDIPEGDRPHDPDDLVRLDAERKEADRAYNDALTRLDRAIQQLPANFPHPPPGPDEHQVTPLNTLWKIDMPAVPRGLRRRFVEAVQQVLAPLFEQQQAFNSAVVDHVNRNIPVQRETKAAIESALDVLQDQIAQLVRFQSLLIMFLQQITPYVDTKDRNVAGLLRGLSGAINGVADELMKRTESLLVRSRHGQRRLDTLEPALAALEQQVGALQRALDEVRVALDEPAE